MLGTVIMHHIAPLSNANPFPSDRSYKCSRSSHRISASLHDVLLLYGQAEGGVEMAKSCGIINHIRWVLTPSARAVPYPWCAAVYPKNPSYSPQPTY
jgi:hypothetical protein